MKKINWSKADQIKRIVDNETPFKVIDCPTGETIKLYWTPRAGQMGHQVHAVVYFVRDNPDDKSEFSTYHFKTGGYGYCKEGSATDAAFRLIGKAPRGYHRENSLQNPSFHVGGNYYRITKKDWLKLKRR